jgi:hypothetical protein
VTCPLLGSRDLPSAGLCVCMCDCACAPAGLPLLVVAQALVRGFLVRLPRLRAARGPASDAHPDAVSADELRKQLERLRASTEAKLATEVKEDEDMPEWKRELKRREAAREAKRKRTLLRLKAVMAIQVGVPFPSPPLHSRPCTAVHCRMLAHGGRECRLAWLQVATGGVCPDWI